MRHGLGPLGPCDAGRRSNRLTTHGRGSPSRVEQAPFAHPDPVQDPSGEAEARGPLIARIPGPHAWRTQTDVLKNRITGRPGPSARSLKNRITARLGFGPSVRSWTSAIGDSAQIKGAGAPTVPSLGVTQQRPTGRPVRHLICPHFMKIGKKRVASAYNP